MGMVILDSSFPIACLSTDQRLKSPNGTAAAGSLSLSRVQQMGQWLTQRSYCSKACWEHGYIAPHCAPFFPRQSTVNQRQINIKATKQPILLETRHACISQKSRTDMIFDSCGIKWYWTIGSVNAPI